MKEYLTCLRNQQDQHHKCRELSRAYLQCRMDRALMAEENLDEMGFSKDSVVENPVSYEGIKEKEGFTAGKHIKKRRKWFFQS